MSTCRRELLDRELNHFSPLMRGNVLDIGGRKNSRRGGFGAPLHQVNSWQYLNINPDTNPDYCCDASAIPCENQSFETIVMTEVLEYLEKPELVLKEIYRILSSNGYALISIPFLNPIHGDYQFDRQRWTSIKLEEMFRQVGFSTINIRPMGAFFSVLHDLIHVSSGYATSLSKKKYMRFIQKCLHLCTPIFLKLDQKANSTKYFVNTGYFIVLKK